MELKDYKELYDKIVSMSIDADSFGLYEYITDEDVEKCKWIYCILSCLEDVPKLRLNHIFAEKGIDADEFEDNEMDSFLDTEY